MKKVLNRKKILQLYDFANGKCVLSKAQIESKLKLISRDEEEICKFIDFICSRQLIDKFTNKQIIKLTNNIVSAKYAKWILKHNLSFNRNKLVTVISKNIDESFTIFKEQILADEENNQLFDKILTDINMVILILGSNIKLNDYQKNKILEMNTQIDNGINQIEEDLKQNYYQYIISDKTDKKYAELVTKAKIYLEHLRE